MLDICLLGTGGVMPLPNRWLTSLLLRYNGKIVLIDCGEGTQIPLAMAKWGFKSIDTILFTHYHADHVAGLPGLLLTIGNSGRVKPLVLIGPPNLRQIVDGLTVISPELPYDLKIIELSDAQYSEINVDDIFIKSIPSDHTLTCLSYCIEIKRQGKFDKARAKQQGIPMDCWRLLQNGETITVDNKQFTPKMVIGEPRKGIKICYCTDTRPTDNLVEFIKDSDLFICEGMYGDDDSLNKAIDKKHMLFSEAARLAYSGNVKELWLTHYSPSLTNPSEYLDVAKNIFSNTFLGKDLLFKTINFQ